MASISSSARLAFYRRFNASQALSYSAVSRTPLRPFSLSTRLAEKDDVGGPEQGKKHTLEKNTQQDVQSHASKSGMASHAQGTGGSATEAKDSNNATQKAKEEFPEAPTTIGFQDERGGKGH